MLKHDNHSHTHKRRGERYEPQGEMALDMDDLLARLTPRNAYRVLGRPVSATLSLLNSTFGTRFESRYQRFDVDTFALLRSRALCQLLSEAVTALQRVRQDPLVAASPGLRLRFARHYSVELLQLCDATWSLTLDFIDARPE